MNGRLRQRTQVRASVTETRWPWQLVGQVRCRVVKDGAGALVAGGELEGAVVGELDRGRN